MYSYWVLYGISILVDILLTPRGKEKEMEKGKLKIKLTVEYPDGSENSLGVRVRTIAKKDGTIDRELTTMHIRAGFIALYRNILEKLGYDKGTVLGLTSSQLRDMSTESQREAVRECRAVIEKIDRMKLEKPCIKPILEKGEG
jgi:hypothetical protein